MKTCNHENKSTIESSFIKAGSNLITVQCDDCKMVRYETRYTTGKSKGRIDTSNWFKKNS